MLRNDISDNTKYIIITIITIIIISVNNYDCNNDDYIYL